MAGPGRLAWLCLAVCAVLAASGTVERLKVGVNVRAIVARILSRYPTKYAMYRELVQNANDADATEISFTLKPCGGDSGGSCLVVSDNGMGFDDTAWERLLTIASGNPDGI